jgi:predicted nuclease of predicted toxin-antitoxin system
MKFKVDENLPTETAGDLRAAGHEAETVAGEGLAGARDSTVVDSAQREGRVLVTVDKGTADIRSYPPQSHSGLILLRPDTAGRGAVLAFFRRHMLALLRLNMGGRLLIVTPRGIRIR